LHFEFDKANMPKVLPQSIPPKIRKRLLKEFYDFINSLSRKETEDFFNDFLTPSEKIILSRRLQVVKLLLQGDRQNKVRRKLGVGVSTVQFVQKWINKELK